MHLEISFFFENIENVLSEKKITNYVIIGGAAEARRIKVDGADLMLMKRFYFSRLCSVFKESQLKITWRLRVLAFMAEIPAKNCCYNFQLVLPPNKFARGACFARYFWRICHSSGRSDWPEIGSVALQRSCQSNEPARTFNSPHQLAGGPWLGKRCSRGRFHATAIRRGNEFHLH